MYKTKNSRNFQIQQVVQIKKIVPSCFLINIVSGLFYSVPKIIVIVNTTSD